jgi:sigma-54 dependent transcriptional regulator, acetoin dehydrogenase operon transcriptional activator AcoR
MQNITDQHNIFKQWKRFFETDSADPELVRSDILISWIRSKEHTVDPLSSNIPSVSEDQLRNRKEKCAVLLDAAVSYMDTIYGFASEKEGIIVLTDKDGVIIERFCEKKSPLEKGTPSLGMIFNEKSVGTNAIGSAIIDKSPTEVSASEHYLKILHRWNCSADIIRDHRGEIIGVLAYFSKLDNDNSHTLSMVAATAGAIERQLKVESSLKEKSRLFKLQNLIMDLIDEGILVIDTSQKIIAANKLACELLSTDSKEIIGRSVYDFIRSGINFLHIISEGINIKEREATVKLKDSVRKFNMSANLIRENALSPAEGLVITIRENKRVHNFVNKVSGSRARLTFNDIIGESSALKETVKLSRSASASSSNVLLLGESGTGKELFAQSIHNASSRSEESFISVNCGAIPRNLVESELFGYEGGAFTGSKKEGHPGKFELADGGTIFLDEIGDMPIDAQVDLLRVIETGEVVRVGGKFPKKIDVRIVAATNVNLLEAVKEKVFRDDLYYRLNVLTINIPPLRERYEDIKPLIDFFIKKVSQKLQKSITSIEKDALDLFYSYSWPGNIRELENVIERAVNISENELITKSELPSFLKNLLPNEPDYKNSRTIKGQEARYIIAALRKNKWNIRKTATQLEIARSTLYEKIKKYGIKRESADKNSA